MRRRRRRRGAGGDAAGEGDDRKSGPPEPAVDPVASPDLSADHAELSWPLSPGRISRRRGAVAAGVALAGVAAWFAAGPAVGILVAVATACAMTFVRGRAVFLFGSLGLMALAVLEVVRHQAVNHYVAGSGWAAHFNLASSLVWASVLLLAADGGLEAVRARRARRLRDAAAASRDEGVMSTGP